MLAVLPLVLVVGCSSSSGGKPSAGSTSATGDIADPVPNVEAVLNSLTSVHLDTDTGTTKGTADVTLTKGTVTALHIMTSQDQVPYETITVGASSYLKLTTPVDGKDWAEVKADSSIPQVKIAASPLSNVGVTTLLASPGSVVALLDAASTSNAAQQTLDGAHVVHWTMQVQPSKVGSSTPIGQLFALLGKDPIPTELWTNDQSQPVKLAFSATLLGEHKDVSVLLSKFNAPLTITAPDPADVTHS